MAWDGRPPGDAADQEGWHWLRCNLHPAYLPEPWQWFEGAWQPLDDENLDVTKTEYLGPCLLPAQHDARVTELLEANNREVERRRVAEAALRVAVERMEACRPICHDREPREAHQAAIEAGRAALAPVTP